MDDLPPVTIGCGAVIGVDAVPITLEATLRAAADAERPRILGRVDRLVREAFTRILSAFRAQGVPAPRGVATLNFAPASVPKRGSSFDLSMGLALAGASGTIPRDHLSGIAAHGEVSLRGRVLPVRGIVAVALAARSAGWTVILCSPEDAPLAALVPGMTAFGVETVAEAVAFLRGSHRLEPEAHPNLPPPAAVPDLDDIRGHHTPKTALVVAAAGGHNLLFVGPPGSGKSALLRRLPGLMPRLGAEEALEVLKIHSGAVSLGTSGRFGERPFRAPHHTSSTAAILGGGIEPRPGECTLAHRGILFLDELPEFRRETLESLRQPLEDGSVTIGRAAGTVAMPADFQLVAAMNPCPCGYAGHPTRPCECPAGHVHRYRARLSGPLLDRMDLQVEVPALPPSDYRGARESEWSTKSLAARVEVARRRQWARNRGENGAARFNGQLADRELERAVAPSSAVLDALDSLLTRQRLSGRARVRILRICRTLADLDDRESVEPRDILEAARLRGWARSVRT